MTRTIHSILQVIGFLISAGTVATNIVPPKYQPYVVLVVSAAQGILAWYNHNFNPDGTPASVAYVAKLLILFLLLGGSTLAQTSTPVQHFVLSGSAAGQPAAITTAGVQVTQNISVEYEYIVNPNDSTKPRYGSGLANYTFGVDKLVPASLKSKLLIDVSNYNLTLQAGAGRESLANPTVGGSRVSHIIGNFGVYGSYPMPGGHSQIGLGYKWILGPATNVVVKVPVATLNFTF